MLPRAIGRYEVLGQLATGGMAEVLLARIVGPADFKRAVVIKRILRQYSKSSAFIAMFLDEARVVAKIRHPNVVQVQELGEDVNGEVFLVLEYVAGENLSSVLKRSVSARERLEPALVAHVIAEACAGLHAAHELVSDEGRRQNLVHRDVSPQNLFVGYDGHVKLLDFGVALTDERTARTQAGDVKGKFEYMSPEQARGDALDRRSDIFAMGIVLYELGTGRRLFKRPSVAQVLDSICKEPVLPPSRLVSDFPKALEAICLRALAKRPEDRYPTAAAMRLDLLELAREFPSPVEALAERMQRWFPERIIEKEEMLRRVRDGDTVDHVPVGEIDEHVGVPNVVDVAERVPGGSFPWLGSLVASARGARYFGIGVGAAVVLVVVGGVVLANRADGAAGTHDDLVAEESPSPSELVPGPVEAPPTEATEASGEVPPTEAPFADPAGLAAPTTPPDGGAVAVAAVAAAQVARVVVRVESRPVGAHVVEQGVDRGPTPLDLHVVRGAAPLQIELRKTGFSVEKRAIVPDVDQKVTVSLHPVVAGRTARPQPEKAPPAPPPTPSSSGGFRRFD